jgi:hypothetical protein
MGAVDIVNQLRESYEVYRASIRNWWPLFYWLINVTIINSYRLYLITMAQLYISKTYSYKEFRTYIYMSLFGFIIDAKLKHAKESLGGKRRYYSTDSCIHYRVKIPQKSCSWCLYIVQCKQIRGEEYKGSRVTRTRSACVFYKAPLCTKGDYWSNYYNIYDY